MMGKTKRLAYRFYIAMSALIIIGGGAALAWGMSYGADRLPLRQYFDRAQTNAVWDWSNPANKTDQDLREIADFLYLHQINTVYVDVGQYKSSLNKQGNIERNDQLKKFEDSVGRYIAAMHKRNVAVYAAAGDTTWSDPSQHQIPLGILGAIHSYNTNHTDAPFAGVEFDIEGYNQPGFADGSMTVKSLGLTDYLDMVDKLAISTANLNKNAARKLGLGFAVPYWFDNQNGNIPSVTWHEKTGPTLYHLLDRLNSLQGSNIVVMSYRNAARGNDGVIALSRTEVEYAQAKAPNVKVIIGQEVNAVEPAKITYYGETATELSSEAKVIGDEFKRSGTYGGIAINDLAGFRAMESTRQ